MRKALLSLTVTMLATVSAWAQLTLVSPNGGETLTGCGTTTVTWSKAGAASDNQRIDYSLNGGTTWLNLVSSVSTAGSSSGTASVVVPNKASTRVKFRVRDVADPNMRDMSDALLSIATSVESNSILVTTPNGGETVNRGQTVLVGWNAGVATGRTYNAYYSINGGQTWILIGQTTKNFINWNITPSSTVSGMIKVEDVAAPCVVDYSDTTFRIQNNPALGLTSFNESKNYQGGATELITWTSNALTSDWVTVEYSLDNGANYILLEDSVEATGAFSWTLPNTFTTQGRVRVSELGNPAVFDESNAPFAIIAPAIIMSEPATTALTGCQTVNLSFTAAGTSGRFNIYFSPDNGLTWDELAYPIVLGNGNVNANVVIPNRAVTQGKFMITDAIFPEYSDVSATTYTVAVNGSLPTINVSSPVQGEVLGQNESFPVKWTTALNGAPSFTNVNVSYSINAGLTWNLLSSPANNGTYNWFTPPVSTSDAIFKVRSFGQACVMGRNTGTFVISSQPIVKVLQPNGGEVLTGNTTYQIKFRTSNLDTTKRVMLEYSTNNGGNWILISSSVRLLGSYQWLVPDVNTSTAKVRITQVGNSAVQDESDFVFTINGNQPPVVNAGPDLTIAAPLDSVVIAATASDPEGGPLTTLWTQVGGPNTAALFGTTTLTLKAKGLVIGTYTFKLAATDNKGAVTEDLVVVTVTGNTPSDVWVWARRAGQTGRDRGNKIVYDGMGHLYVAGSFTGNVNFQTENLSSVGGSQDLMIVKYDTADGTVLWARSAGAPGEDEAWDIAYKASTNTIYISGFVTGNSTFGSISLTGRGSHDAIAAAMSADGNWLWAKSMGGSGNDEAFAVKVGNGGDVFVGGFFNQNGNFVTSSYTSRGSDDGFLVRMSPADGSVIWAERIGGPGSDVVYDITTNGAGPFVGIALTGKFGSTATFGTGGSALPLTSAGGADIFIAGYLEDGSFLGARREGGPGDDFGYAITTSGADAAIDPLTTYVAGHFSNTMTIMGGQPMSSKGNTDVFLAQYNSGGTPIRATSFGSTAEDQIRDILLEGNRIYLAGWYSASFTHQGNQFTNRTGKDVFYSSHNLDGTMLFAATAGGNSDDWARGITSDGGGNIYLTGWYINTSEFGQFTLPRAANGDFFIARHNAASVPVAEDRQVVTKKAFKSSVNAARIAAEDAIAGNLTIKAVPNPASKGSSVSLITSGLNEGDAVTVIVTDVSGRRVTSMERTVGFAGSVGKLDLTNVQAGTYMVVCQTPAGATKQVLVVR